MVNKDIRGFVRRGLVNGIVGSLLYTGALCATESFTEAFSPSIKDKQGLEKVLKIEAKKLNLDPSKIDATIVNYEKARSDFVKDGEYSLTLGNGGLNEATLRHELYHIADGHLDRQEKIPKIFPLRFIHYFFWCEPQAAIYEATGIKL